MNTYGLHSITSDSFNIKLGRDLVYPRDARDLLVTFFRVHNLVLNILGYIPGVSLISGSVRLATGAVICIVTLGLGNREASKGIIVGHWYDEALLTGVTQIARGVLEALVPFGWVANAFFDAAATIDNMRSECKSYPEHGSPVQPHREPDYPLPFSFLYLG
ncbi:MAG TPA: hypothetical protein DCE71_04720 [Parachlamydiales bacterium]|nr:hypothetical protein [Parachlamydiales bacterium]